MNHPLNGVLPGGIDPVVSLADQNDGIAQAQPQVLRHAFSHQGRFFVILQVSPFGNPAAQVGHGILHLRVDPHHHHSGGVIPGRSQGKGFDARQYLTNLRRLFLKLLQGVRQGESLINRLLIPVSLFVHLHVAIVVINHAVDHVIPGAFLDGLHEGGK